MSFVAGVDIDVTRTFYMRTLMMILMSMLLLLLLLKPVGIDDDVALLRIVRSSRCVGMKMTA